MEEDSASSAKLRQEVSRLYELVDLKTRQSEDWKRKYVNMDTSNNCTFVGKSLLNIKSNLLDNIEESQVLEQQQLTTKDDQLKRGRSPLGTNKYQTQMLFKKREKVPSPILDVAAKSYIDDIDIRK